MKKLIAILLALTLALVPMTMAVADDSAMVGTGSSLTGEGDGYGVIADISEVELFIVELPTSRAFEFILDPQGVYGIALEDLTDPAQYSIIDVPTDNAGDFPMFSADGTNPLDTAGQVVFRGNAAPYIINHGNQDTDISISFDFVEDAGATIVAQKSDVNDTDDTKTDDIDPDVFIGATFAKDGFVATASSLDVIPDDLNELKEMDSSEDIEGIYPDYFVGDRTVAVVGTPTVTPVLKIPAADYTDKITATGGATVDENTEIIVERNATYVGNSKGTLFLLNGVCNPLSDWSAIDLEGLNIVITYEIGAATVAAGDQTSDAAYLFGNSATIIDNDTAGFAYADTDYPLGNFEPVGGGSVKANAGFIIDGELAATRPNANMSRNTWVRVTDFEFDGTTIAAMYDGDFLLTENEHYRTGTRVHPGSDTTYGGETVDTIEMRFGTASTKNVKLVLSDAQEFTFVLVVS